MILIFAFFQFLKLFGFFAFVKPREPIYVLSGFIIGYCLVSSCKGMKFSVGNMLLSRILAFFK